jgi:hypothetical protein
MYISPLASDTFSIHMVCFDGDDPPLPPPTPRSYAGTHLWLWQDLGRRGTNSEGVYLLSHLEDLLLGDE